jgi:hypothetical protein
MIRTIFLPMLVLISALCASTVQAAGLTWPLACELGRDCWVQAFPEGAGASRAIKGDDGSDIRVADQAAMRRGVAVLAAEAGVVVALRDSQPDDGVTGYRARRAPPGGNVIVIRSMDGHRTIAYGHLKQGSVAVQVGQSVASGQPIAQVGMSGQTSFPHLNLLVFERGRPINIWSRTDLVKGWKAAPAAAAPQINKIGWSSSPTNAVLLQDRTPPAPTGRAAPHSVQSTTFYASVIGPQAGDREVITLTDGRGRSIGSPIVTLIDTDIPVRVRTITIRADLPSVEAHYTLIRGNQIIAARSVHATIST